MVLKQWVRGGIGMLIAGTALHAMGLATLADDVQSADYETSNVSRSKQVSPVAHQSEGCCGVAKVPGRATGPMNCGATACGPRGYIPNPGWGPCGCPSCRAARRGVPAEPTVDLYTFHDAGQTWCDAGHSMRDHAVSWARPQSDWNEEMYSRPCPAHGCRHCSRCCGWWDEQWAMFQCRNRQQGGIIRAHIHGKLAYLQPMGNGGEGVPPVGCYNFVYAADPNYSDRRDGQVYAAQGYGVPIAVPLAPTVRHTMNYSNGMPSSRLTPISNVVPTRGGRGW
ncbi:MAG: hypothetical protein ACKV2Q_34375 [Planctomycetaceae bacterium]